MYYDAPLFFNTLQNRANEAGSNQVHFISYLKNLVDVTCASEPSHTHTFIIIGRKCDH